MNVVHSHLLKIGELSTKLNGYHMQKYELRKAPLAPDVLGEVDQLLGKVRSATEELYTNICALVDSDHFLESWESAKRVMRCRSCLMQAQKRLEEKVSALSAQRPRTRCLGGRIELHAALRRQVKVEILLVDEFLERFESLHHHWSHRRQWRQRGLASKQIDRLEHYVYTDEQQRADGDVCAICLGIRQSGDLIMELPCRHKFHRYCSRQALSMKPCCPVCMGDLHDV